MQTISVVGWLPQTTNRKPQFAELGKEWLTQEVLLWMYVFLAISYCYYRSFGRLRALEVLSAPAPTLGSNFPVISLKSFVKCSKRSKGKKSDPTPDKKARLRAAPAPQNWVDRGGTANY